MYSLVRSSNYFRMARHVSLLLAATITLFLAACMTHNAHPEVYGHRGCRGLMPENTIAGFIKATELGVDHLELDVVMSDDGQVIVSHEPWMAHHICTQPNGDSIPETDERSFNIYHMNVAEIRSFDCGSLEQTEFPEQQQQKAYKPLLREVVEAVEEHALFNGIATPGYAIEIKSEPALYGSHQPPPATFVRSVIDAVDSLGIADRCVIQSFDPAVLEVVHAERPDITVSFLVENDLGWKENLKRLSFEPDIYSPWFGSVSAKDVEKLHDKNVEVVLWTVNEEADLRKVIALGVDGIISDYPDRVLALLEEE